jgi:CRP/FNR family transcriptional regulator, cyclic AMP receptor protein
MDSLHDFLGNSLWAKNLEVEQMRRVEAEVHEARFPAGAIICSKGQPVDAWFGVIEGLMKVHAGSPDGKSVTFTGIPAGGWVGEGSLLRTEPRRYGVIALRDTRLALMPRSTFERLLDTNIGFNRYLLAQLNERLAQFIAVLEYERLLDTDARIARSLGELFNPILYPGVGMKLSISQEEIGFLTGVSRQRVNQALQQLEKEGLLALEYGGLRVLDLPRLRGYGA